MADEPQNRRNSSISASSGNHLRDGHDQDQEPSSGDILRERIRGYEGLLEIPRYLAESQDMINTFNKVQPPHPETCQWLFKTAEYLNWKTAKNGLLCVTGSPASGKSVLLRHLVHELSSTPGSAEDCLVLKGFFSAWVPSTLSLKALLCSLLYQMLIQRFRGVQLSSMMPSHSQHNLDSGELVDLFFHFLEVTGRSQIPIYIVIDALDECKEANSTTDISLFIADLLEISRKEDLELHLCVSKRDFPIIQFPNKTPVLSMDDHNLADIHTTVENALQLWAEDYSSNESEQLVGEVLRRSGTGFLVSRLYVKGIIRSYEMGHSTRDIQRLLDAIPREAEALCFSALDRLEPSCIEDATKLFGCVCAAHQSLAPQDLVFVSGLDWPSFKEDSDEFKRKLTTTTGGLLSIQMVKHKPSTRVEINSSTIDFVQPVMRQILVNSSDPERCTFRMNMPHAHAMFLEKCVKCLQEFVPFYSAKWQRQMPTYDDEMNLPLAPISEKANKMPKNAIAGFLSYAIDSLFFHLEEVANKNRDTFRVFLSELEGYCEVETKNKDQAQLPLRLLDVWGHVQNSVNGTAAYGRSVSFLHICSRFDMAGSTSWWLENSRGYNMKTKGEQSALHWAAFYGSETVASTLLKKSFKDRVDSLVVDAGNKSSSERDKDQSLGKDMKRRRQELKQTVQTWSMAKGVFLSNSSDRENRTPLHFAVSQKHSSMVRKLIDMHEGLKMDVEKVLKTTYEIDIVEEVEGDFTNNVTPLNIGDENDNTPLHLASEFGHFPIVEFLLQSGADWRVTNSEGKTPEVVAALKSREMKGNQSFKSIVRLLKATAYASPDLAQSAPKDSMSVDKLFDAIMVRITLEGGQSIERTSISMHEFFEDSVNMYEDPKRLLSWVHIPANNMIWIELVMRKFLRERERAGVNARKNPGRAEQNYSMNRDVIMRRELWTHRQHRGSAQSRISFMRPGCQQITPQGPGKDDLVLFMPYIHWETQERQEDLEAFIFCQLFVDSKEKRPTNWQDILSEFLLRTADLPKNPETKTRQRLEEFYSSLHKILEKIAKGDSEGEKSQAGDPWGACQKAAASFEKASFAASDDRDKKLIQLYTKTFNHAQALHIRRTLDHYFYYMLDSTASRNKDQVVSRYGRKMERSQPVVMMVDQLWLWVLDGHVITSFPQRQETLHDPDRFGMTDVFECIFRLLPKVRDHKDLTRIIISECLGVCMDQSRYLENDFRFLDMFENSIGYVAHQEARCYDRFTQALSQKEELDSSDIKTESDLLREIKDIRDELQIIKVICESQSLAMLEWLRCRREQESTILSPQILIDQYNGKVKAMEEQAEATYNALNDLMDLRQKHANLKQTEETGRQGNIIMVFTIVTILFLPASFMASFFALPINQFRRVESTSLNLSYVVTWMMAFTVPLAIFFISIAFYINQIVEILKGAIGKGEKEQQPDTRPASQRRNLFGGREKKIAGEAEV